MLEVREVWAHRENMRRIINTMKHAMIVRFTLKEPANAGDELYVGKAENGGIFMTILPFSQMREDASINLDELRKELIERALDGEGEHVVTDKTTTITPDNVDSIVNADRCCAKHDKLDGLDMQCGLAGMGISRESQYCCSKCPYKNAVSVQPQVSPHALLGLASNEQDYWTISAMRASGGSFVKALAEAANHADAVNLKTIKESFAELWKYYEDRGRDLASERASG